MIRNLVAWPVCSFMSEMSTQDSRDLRTCKKCGHVFNRVHGSCPQCGTLRDSRRPKKLKHRLRHRLERIKLRATSWYEAHRWYVIYVGGGALLAATIQPLTMFLAEFSRPEDWRERRWEAGWSLKHFFEPFLAAGETLWRWLTVGIVGFFSWLGESLAWLIMAKPSTVFAILFGGGIGAFLAWRRSKRQRRRRHRNRAVAATPQRALRPTPSATSDRELDDPSQSEDSSRKD